MAHSATNSMIESANMTATWPRDRKRARESEWWARRSCVIEGICRPYWLVGLRFITVLSDMVSDDQLDPPKKPMIPPSDVWNG